MSLAARLSCSVSEVPPFRFLAPDRSLEDAVRLAAKALRLSNPLDILVLAWKLRAAVDTTSGACAAVVREDGPAEATDQGVAAVGMPGDEKMQQRPDWAP